MYLPCHYSFTSMRAAMALQSSLTEVEWNWCDFSCKSDTGVVVLVCCVWYICVSIGGRRESGEDRDGWGLGGRGRRREEGEGEGRGRGGEGEGVGKGKGRERNGNKGGRIGERERGRGKGRRWRGGKGVREWSLR